VSTTTTCSRPRPGVLFNQEEAFVSELGQQGQQIETRARARGGPYSLIVPQLAFVSNSLFSRLIQQHNNLSTRQHWPALKAQGPLFVLEEIS